MEIILATIKDEYFSNMLIGDCGDGGEADDDEQTVFCCLRLSKQKRKHATNRVAPVCLLLHETLVALPAMADLTSSTNQNKTCLYIWCRNLRPPTAKLT